MDIPNIPDIPDIPNIPDIPEDALLSLLKEDYDLFEAHFRPVPLAAQKFSPLMLLVMSRGRLKII